MNKLLQPWAKYVAMDADGQCYQYSEKPGLDYNLWAADGDKASPLAPSLKLDFYGDWKDSLFTVEEAPFYLEWSDAIKYMLDNPGEKLRVKHWGPGEFLAYNGQCFEDEDTDLESVSDLLSARGYKTDKFFFYKEPSKPKTVTVYRWRMKKADKNGHIVNTKDEYTGDTFDSEWEPIPGTEREVEIDEDS